MSVGVSHNAPILGNQTHVPCVGVGAMPGSHNLPHSGLGHVDHAPVPGSSGVGQGLSAPMPVSHPLSAARSCEDDEDVPPNQENVSLFLHLIGQVRAYLYLPSPEDPSLSQLMGVERPQGSVLPCQPSVTLPLSLRAQAVHEEPYCTSIKEPKPCSVNFELFGNGQVFLSA
ncbi:hypothetical protein E2C01_081895 [Portunus trituberculatus]|uniref:Uncharacterized protein n=1 Tax=Portunus trituberculatus TaxID=210409 RepID=A0A5B7J041_PORTR|nr:hypothetical protein [Portunus trituberculatus]